MSRPEPSKPTEAGDRSLARFLCSLPQRGDAEHAFTASLPDGAPAPLTPLIGRSDDVEALMTLCGRHRLVWVTGPAGVGKTRLAAAVAAAMNERLPGRVDWVTLGPVCDVDELYRCIALEAGAQSHVGRSTLEQVEQAISDRERTIVLDGVDNVAAAAEAMVRLLRWCPRLRLLVTARRCVDVAGAVPFRVGPLDTPIGQADDEDLLEHAAVRLFVALAAHHGQTVDTARLAQVGEICRRLDGLPLSLELAAAQLGTMTLDELTASLRRDDAVPEFMTATPTSHVTAFESGWDELSPLAQHLLACCSVFRGPFDLDRVARVVVFSQEVVRASLRELVWASMVHVELDAMRGTYRMLAPIRQLAAAKLDELGQTDEVRRRHARHVADTLYEAFPIARRDVLDRFGWDDVLSALRWALHADTTLSVRIAGNVWPHWQREGAFSAGQDLLAQVLDRADDDVPGRVRVTVGAGVLAGAAGDVLAGAASLIAGCATARAARDYAAEAVALVNVAPLALLDGCGRGAMEYAERALDSSQRSGFTWGEARAYQARADVRQLRHELTAAIDDLTRSLKIAESIDDVTSVAMAKAGLARAALDRGDDRAARLYAGEALADAERTGDSRAVWSALIGVGLAAKAQGDWDEAVAHLERAAALTARSEDPMGRCSARVELAVVRGHVAGDQASTSRAIDNLMTATHDAFEANAYSQLPMCFEAMSDIAREVLGSATTDWLRRAATCLEERFATGNQGEGPSPEVQASIRALVDVAPDHEMVAQFRDIVHWFTDYASEEPKTTADPRAAIVAQDA